MNACLSFFWEIIQIWMINYHVLSPYFLLGSFSVIIVGVPQVISKSWEICKGVAVQFNISYFFYTIPTFSIEALSLLYGRFLPVGSVSSFANTDPGGFVEWGSMLIRFRNTGRCKGFFSRVCGGGGVFRG